MTAAAGDSWLERFGDRVNPILVKETRQALKSRQFALTFGLVLLLSLLVSLVGVALGGPGLPYLAAGPIFFLAYFAVLAFAVFVVVPFGAYRSLSAEQEEGTFELLAISALTPRQVIAGKLLSAIVQMFIYYSALAPYMAFAVLLKGIDVPSIVLALFLSLLVAIGLAMIALLHAALSGRRGWQIFFSLLLIPALLAVAGLAVGLVGAALLEMGPFLRDPAVWRGGALVLLVYLTYFLLAFELSAVQLTFEADNRSTRVRVALLVQSLVFLGALAYVWEAEGGRRFLPLTMMSCPMVAHWFVAGSFLVSEPVGMSARVARQVPRKKPWRALAAVFFPGPGTGLAFLLGNLACVVALVALGELTTDQPRPSPNTRDMQGRWPTAFALAAAAYVFLYCGLGAAVVQAIRRRWRLPVLAGALITWLIAILGFLVPNFFALALWGDPILDYRIWQISDPVTTLAQVQGSSQFPLNLTLLPCGLAALVFLLNLGLMTRAAREIGGAGRKSPTAEPTLTAEPLRATASV